MEQAIQAYHQITADPEFRELERMRETARHNEASALRHARDEGITEGEAKGRAESMAQVAQKLKAMGFSNEQIQTVTG